MELVIVRVGFHCFGVALRVLRVLGWWMLHICACSVSAEIAKSCGTATSATTMIPLPCARTPSTHMGTRPPHTTLTGKARHPNKNQSPPHKGRSLPCAASTTTTPTRRHLDAAQPTHHKLELELDRSQRGLRPISRRRCTDLDAELDRSRRGSGPISARVTTDLAAEHDRPNGGERGIRTPGAPGAQRFSRPPHSAALSSLHARQPLEPFDARAGDPTLPPPPRCATTWPTRAIRFSRLNRLS